jgi:hypothetical protein
MRPEQVTCDDVIKFIWSVNVLNKNKYRKQQARIQIKADHYKNRAQENACNPLIT